MRIPVVDTRGVPLMPCTPAKARHLFKSGKARPKRNKLGLFYVQLCYEQEPDNQPLVAGIDPGSTFEGYSVVGTKDTVLNLMVEAPDHVKDAIETRRTMRRARRHRKWRRPKRFDNRLNRKRRIPPSTRSRWEAKVRLIMQLQKVLPLTAVVVEDVQAVTRQGKGGKWNSAFSPIQVGKEQLYRLLREMGLAVHTREGWQTKALREKSGLKKTKSKSKQSFASHAVDAWVMAASVSGAEKPTCTRLWYVNPAVLHRRQLHRLQACKGGIRKPYGGTRSLGLKRGTVVRHTKYGLCTVGGVDRKRNTISLHDYQTNKRLTQGAKVEACRILTWVAFRSWLVKEQGKRKGKGSPPGPRPKQGPPVSSHSLKAYGSPQSQSLMTSFQSGSRQLEGYMARPEGDGPFPGIVIIHELFGLNENMKDISRRFAAQGYVALAVDLFAGRNRAVCMFRLMGGLLLNPLHNSGIHDLKAALTFLSEQPGVDDSRLGAVGYCLGGSFAIAWACTDERLQAIAPYYAGNPRPLKAVARLCPVVGSYPDKDFTTSAGQKLDVELDRYHVPHDIKIYPGAKHSFFNDTIRNYNESAAQDSWRRVLAFFEEHLEAKAEV